MDNQLQQGIHLIVRQREKVLFQGDIKAFTSYSEKGEFDILYEHANFISLINKNCIIHKHDGTKTELKIEQGIVSAYQNKVVVYLGIIS